MPKSIGVGKDLDRADIAAERRELPFLAVEIGERNDAIVLEDSGAVFEKETAHRRESTALKEIGWALEQAVGRAEPCAERQKAAFLCPVIGEVGVEIIKRLHRAVGGGEYDLDAFGLGFHAALVGRMQHALVVDVHEAGFVDGFSGARQEYVKDRERTEDRPLVELNPHVLGDEEADR